MDHGQESTDLFDILWQCQHKDSLYFLVEVWCHVFLVHNQDIVFLWHSMSISLDLSSDMCIIAWKYFPEICEVVIQAALCGAQ